MRNPFKKDSSFEDLPELEVHAIMPPIERPLGTRTVDTSFTMARWFVAMENALILINDLELDKSNTKAALLKKELEVLLHVLSNSER